MFIAKAWGEFVEGKNHVKYQLKKEGYRCPVPVGVSPTPEVDFVEIPNEFSELPKLGSKIMIIGINGSTILWTDDLVFLGTLSHRATRLL